MLSNLASYSQVDVIYTMHNKFVDLWYLVSVYGKHFVFLAQSPKFMEGFKTIERRRNDVEDLLSSVAGV